MINDKLIKHTLTDLGAFDEYPYQNDFNKAYYNTLTFKASKVTWQNWYGRNFYCTLPAGTISTTDTRKKSNYYGQGTADTVKGIFRYSNNTSVYVFEPDATSVEELMAIFEANDVVISVVKDTGTIVNVL